MQPPTAASTIPIGMPSNKAHIWITSRRLASVSSKSARNAGSSARCSLLVETCSQTNPTIAITATDIKRVLAYSTVSQLGYMVAAMGAGAYTAGLFHLFTHGCFKACLFLCAGAVTHAMADNRDMRRMGGLRKMMPFTFAMMLFGSLALTAFPLTAGFVSKDFIIETTWFDHTLVGQYTYWMTLIAAFLTALYTWRLMFFTFEGNFRGGKAMAAHVHDPPWTMAVPMAILAAGAAEEREDEERQDE